MLVIASAAQDASNETVVYSTVIINYHGDRTPLILPIQNMLTSLGAKQLESAGSFFRQRYIAAPQGNQESNTLIDGIRNDLDNTQVNILSTLEQYAVASAQAFMQGLYPPTNISSRLTIDNTFDLSNGTVIEAPLGGYQYPQIYTTSLDDPASIYVAGDTNCLTHDYAASVYAQSQESLGIKSATQDFYTSFQAKILNGVFPSSRISYDEAYHIYDYMNYGYVHNKTIRGDVSSDDLARARGLADQQMHAFHGNTSDNSSVNGNSIQNIAGQTMASVILSLFDLNIENQGATSKISVVFGDFQPLLAFAALAQLPKVNTDFYGMPNYGSSMVFEMYGNKRNGTGLSSLDDLYVRFFFRNGTNASSPLSFYPLFGGSDTQRLSLDDFVQEMQKLATPSVHDWCFTCQSESAFCAAYHNISVVNVSESGPPTAVAKRPAIAGIIGAVIGLAIGGIILAALMVLGGVRFHRSKAQRRSELGGFKAGEKLASDPDLPRGPSVAGASIVKNGEERVGSWELRENAKAKDMVAGGSFDPSSIQNSSYEEDDLGLHHSNQPVKIDERV